MFFSPLLEFFFLLSFFSDLLKRRYHWIIYVGFPADMQKFPLRMKDNDLLVTELYKDPANDMVTALSVYLTPKTSKSLSSSPPSVLPPPPMSSYESVTGSPQFMSTKYQQWVSHCLPIPSSSPLPLPHMYFLLSLSHDYLMSYLQNTFN